MIAASALLDSNSGLALAVFLFRKIIYNYRMFQAKIHNMLAGGNVWVRKALRSMPELKYILGWFFLTRLYLGVVGVLARINIEGPNNFVYSKYIWLAIWGVWDSGWYLPLAKYGYSAILSTRAETFNQANYAFFPLYPLIMHTLTYIVHDYFVSGLIVSNCALIIACVYLYKLASLDFDNQTSLRAVRFALIWPISFIFSGVFTESLYFMLAVMLFYYTRKELWAIASLLGLFLALTRFVGVLILIPLLLEYLNSINFNFKKVGNDLFYFFLIPAGLGIFAWYNFLLTNDAFAFLKVQFAWGRHLSNPFEVLLDGLLFGSPATIFNMLYSLATIILVALFYKKFRPSYLIFIVYSIFVPMFSGLESMPRYLLVIFPLFFLAAQVSKKPYVNLALSLGFILTQGFLMIFWTTGFNLIK